MLKAPEFQRKDTQSQKDFYAHDAGHRGIAGGHDQGRPGPVREKCQTEVLSDSKDSHLESHTDKQRNA